MPETALTRFTDKNIEPFMQRETRVAMLEAAGAITKTRSLSRREVRNG